MSEQNVTYPGSRTRKDRRAYVNGMLAAQNHQRSRYTGKPLGGTSRYTVLGGTRIAVSDEHYEYLYAHFNLDGTVLIAGHNYEKGHYSLTVPHHPFNADFNEKTIGAKYANREIEEVDAWIREQVQAHSA